MEYSHRYQAYPTQEVVERLDHHIDIHRQAYNYTRDEYQNVDADNIASASKHHSRLPDWKEKFPLFSEVNSKALQL
jgi:Helix-turn-helix domain.